MNKAAFDELIAQGYNRIPLVSEVMADLDTPLSAYLKLANQPYSYLFESVQGGEQWGRYSMIGLGAKELLSVRGHDVEVFRLGRLISSERVDDPLAFIETYQQQFKVPQLEGLPRFHGGLVGYFAYETIHYIEPRLEKASLEKVSLDKTPKPDPINAPDILLMLSDELVVFDNLANKMYLIVHAQDGEWDASQLRLEQLAEQMRQPLSLPETHQGKSLKETDFVSGFTQEGFQQAVEQSKEYIRNGDIMQVVLSQRLSVEFQAPPIDLYRALRSLNPSPYMYYLNLGEHYVVGSSPEILVRLEDDQVTVRPIAGTRKRGATPEKDVALEQELLADPKEIAEHLMLIDLGRNDAGRVAQTGSVNLSAKMVIERYSHVMHIVSNVEAKLKPNLNAMDVLRATFPAASFL